MVAQRSIRDFVYLDFERVRSFVAQAMGGIAEETVQTRTHAGGGEVKGGGGIPGLFHGSGGVDYRYVRSDQETKSLHHFVFSQLERHLEESSMILEISGEFDFGSWSRDLFQDGQFVRTTGYVRVLDFAWLAQQFEILPSMFKSFQHAMTYSLNQRKASGEVDELTYKREKAKLEDPGKQIRELKLDKFTSLLQQLYGDMIRVKLLPSPDHPDKVFACSATRAFFTDPPSVLLQRYGYSNPPRWSLLGQISHGATTATPLQMPIGDTMEDKFEQVALGFGKLLEMAVSVAFPAVSVTPIAIYRNVLEGSV